VCKFLVNIFISVSYSLGRWRWRGCCFSSHVRCMRSVTVIIAVDSKPPVASATHCRYTTASEPQPERNVENVHR